MTCGQWPIMEEEAFAACVFFLIRSELCGDSCVVWGHIGRPAGWLPVGFLIDRPRGFCYACLTFSHLRHNGRHSKVVVWA